ncbi:hypothetical protein [Microbispora sp. H11081]|uniref:hypothetical protein n=1 Tax=Microbispora sp. H11081 TaxID=2729107 RepID=UPI001475F366|nr:hypothetical protein [Microbispora sp. H11081]
MSTLTHLVRGGAHPRILPTLALNESRRLLFHPLNLLGMVLWILDVATSGWDGPRPAFTAITVPMTMFWGVPLFFAANLVTSASRRAGTEELLGVLPRGWANRTGGLCLAALAPFLAGVLGQAMVLGLYVVTDNPLERYPTIPELMSGPINLLGACLLGIAVARWLPWPGVPLLVMVALVRVNQHLNTAARLGEEAGPLHLLGFYADFARWGPYPHLAPSGFNPGSAAWHAVYLLAMCLGAGALAMLARPSRRWLWLAVGAVAAVIAAVAGTLTMP